MTLAELLRRRRAVAAQRESLAANDALFALARRCRREAQAYLNVGRPDLAAECMVEAELFEGAAQEPHGL